MFGRKKKEIETHKHHMFRDYEVNYPYVVFPYGGYTLNIDEVVDKLCGDMRDIKRHLLIQQCGGCIHQPICENKRLNCKNFRRGVDFDDKTEEMR